MKVTKMKKAVFIMSLGVSLTGLFAAPASAFKGYCWEYKEACYEYGMQAACWHYENDCERDPNR